MPRPSINAHLYEVWRSYKHIDIRCNYNKMETWLPFKKYGTNWPYISCIYTTRIRMHNVKFLWSNLWPWGLPQTMTMPDARRHTTDNSSLRRIFGIYVKWVNYHFDFMNVFTFKLIWPETEQYPIILHVLLFMETHPISYCTETTDSYHGNWCNSFSDRCEMVI